LDSARILAEGRNCWRIAQADRAAFLVDAAEYFAAARAAMLEAERSIFILGWDIHSRMRLCGVEPPTDGLPAELGPFLNALLHRRRRLRVYILVWDFAMIYAVEREVLPLLNREWNSHRRMHFRLDSDHPLGASHHQKIVLVDEAVAFCGGIDLTMRRWDTSEHLPLDRRRTDPSGVPYGPFHDIQMAVDGDAARSLAVLVRERWRRATGRRVRPHRGPAARWPQAIRTDMRDVPVALARTEPAHGSRPEIREVQRLWEDAIAAAERSIYIENQYLTATNIGDALIRRLAEPEGPEIVIVLPKCAHGWLEQSVLADQQQRLMRRLYDADRHDRLRLVYPVLPGDGPADERWVRIHAKSLVVDDRLVRIGSSNTSNRSMGVDTECDLAIESRNPAEAAAIAGYRDRLLGEHLGCGAAQVAAAIKAHDGSLLRAIDRLSTGERRLVSILDELPPDPLALHADGAIEANPFDPERPIQPDRFIDDFLPEAPPRHRLSKKVAGSVAYLAIVVALLAAWALTPLRHLVTLDAILDEIDEIRGSLWTPFAVVGGFVVGGILMVPVLLLIAVSAVAFGPLFGFAYATLGVFASASCAFAVGRLVGRETVRRIAGRRLNKIGRRLARSGILTVAAVRMLPIAPFTLVNLIAGAMHVRYRDYIAGTAVGMIPGIFLMTFLGATVERVLRGGDWTGLALAVLAIGALGAIGYGLQRWVRGSALRETAAAGD
jgi:phospholipase D1/2